MNGCERPFASGDDHPPPDSRAPGVVRVTNQRDTVFTGPAGQIPMAESRGTG